MKPNRVPQPPVDAYVVALDETRNYNIDPKDAPYIERIVGIYLLDRNLHTYLCESVPSYYLIHLYDEVWVRGDVDAEKREALGEKYENWGGDDTYVHCSDLNGELDAAQKAASHGTQFAHHVVQEHVQEYSSVTARDERIEELREFLCGNHVL